MTKELFFSSSGRLDRYISRTPGRKILLLVDNFTAHGKKEEMPPLDNVRAEFLLQKTTSKLQSLYAGIIAWLKEKYNRRLLFRVLENVDVRKSLSII